VKLHPVREPVRHHLAPSAIERQIKIVNKPLAERTPWRLCVLPGRLACGEGARRQRSGYAPGRIFLLSLWLVNGFFMGLGVSLFQPYLLLIGA
jgi:hypothetical protein